MATMNDVAKLAGVSRSTVSIVINGLQQERKIPEETCQRVYEAMRVLNYQPNIMAKRLRGNSKSKPLIALYWPTGFRNNYMSRYIQGFQSFIQREQYDCELVVRAFNEGTLRSEIDDILHSNYSAAIFVATSQDDMDVLDQVHPNIPVVLMNRKSSIYNTVSADYEAMAESCVLHLVSRNISEIAVLTTDEVHLSSTLRTETFLQHAAQHGITIAQEDILASPAEISGAIEVTQQYLSGHHTARAIYCDSDYLALGLSYTCAHMGIRIPEDIEIIAIGMLSPDFTEYSNPSITIDLIPVEEMAAESVRIVVNAIETKSRDIVHRTYPGIFLCRESSPAPDQ